LQRAVASSFVYRSENFNTTNHLASFAFQQNYRSVTRNCGEGLQIGKKYAVLPDRRVLGVRNRSVTRNCGEGLQIWVKHGSFADATLLRVNERGEYRFYPKVRPYTPFLRRNATYINRFF